MVPMAPFAAGPQGAFDPLFRIAAVRPACPAEEHRDRPRPTRAAGRALGTLVAVLGLASVVAAQVPKPGDYYEDSVELGFRVKVPKKWFLTPPQPGERYLISQFAHPTQSTITVGNGDILPLSAFLLKFDHRQVDAEADAPKKVSVLLMQPEYSGVKEWIEERLAIGSGWYVEDGYPKQLKLKDVEAEEYVFVGRFRRNTTSPPPKEKTLVKVYAAVYTLEPGLDVALVFDGPGDRKWTSYERAFQKMAKTFKRVKVEGLGHDAELLARSSPRAQKRAELERYVGTTPGWSLYETENFFVLSNNEDAEFLEEAMERLEAIRAVFETYYPPETARKIVDRTKWTDDAEDGETEGPIPDDRSVSAVDPLELSRTCVVRVCSNRKEYVTYGGPASSSGYWNWGTKELVFYDDRDSGGRRMTWSTLNHEAFQRGGCGAYSRCHREAPHAQSRGHRARQADRSGSAHFLAHGSGRDPRMRTSTRRSTAPWP